MERLRRGISSEDQLPSVKRLPIGTTLICQPNQTSGQHIIINHDIVELFNSRWSSQVVLAPISNDNVKFCTTKTTINKVTIKDVRPPPLMDDICCKLGRAANFSPMDLEFGFCQSQLQSKIERKRLTGLSPNRKF